MLRNYLRRVARVVKSIEKSYEFDIRYRLHEKMLLSENPLNKAGRFGFSQNEEDGILREIINRLCLKEGYFCEFGVGNGTENNTLTLLMQGWSGVWFGGEDLAYSTDSAKNLDFYKCWIDKDNIIDLYNTSKKKYNVVSMDLDGNDYHLVEKILQQDRTPDIFIVEYNSKFQPDIEFIMNYNREHVWMSNDYFGASLTSYQKLFDLFGYSLVCCNITGSNAFFVKKSDMHYFSDVPANIDKLYHPPFHFYPEKKMHRTSIAAIEHFLEK